jgi:hypothetical protein
VVTKLGQQARSNATLSQFAAYALSASRHVAYLVESSQQDDKLVFDVVGDYGEIKPENIEQFIHTYSKNMLITAFTLFDTFLSDTTRFLLLIHPNVIEDRKVRMRDILNCKSMAEVIDEEVVRVIRGLSIESHRKRIKYLKDNFGIDTNTWTNKLDDLDRYELLRNEVVHDVSLFLYAMGDQPGELQVAQKAETTIHWKTAEEALLACVEMIQALSIEICNRLFGTQLDEELADYMEKFMETLRKDIALSVEASRQKNRGDL